MTLSQIDRLITLCQRDNIPMPEGIRVGVEAWKQLDEVFDGYGVVQYRGLKIYP